MFLEDDEASNSTLSEFNEPRNHSDLDDWLGETAQENVELLMDLPIILTSNLTPLIISELNLLSSSNL